MELFDIKREKVDRILHNLAQATTGSDFTVAEVTIAIAEFMGRMVIGMCDTPISGLQMATVMEEHIKRTMHAGFTAKGFNMGAVEVPRG